MKRKHSAGTIVFTQNGKREYLILYKKLKKIMTDICKGTIEKGESEKETAKRELFEETGIKNVKWISSFVRKINYKYIWDGEKIDKDVVFFIGQTSSKNIKLSKEHFDYKWFTYEDAKRELMFKNQKLLLESANNFLNDYFKKESK